MTATSHSTDRLITRLYEEVHDIARRWRFGERRFRSLETTAILHEAYFRLRDSDEWQSDDAFLAAAAVAIRRVLVEHARRALAAKRPPANRRVTLSSLMDVGQDPRSLLDLDRLLDELTSMYQRPGRVVELRFFGGLSESETADLLGVSRQTVARDWRWARAWLYQQLQTQS